MKQREIKFRAWDGRQMLTMSTEHYSYPSFFDKNGCVHLEWSVYHLMQYVGMTDRRGADIYEGDRLKGRHWRYDEDIIGTVVWLYGYWALQGDNGEPIEFWNDGEHNWYNLSAFEPGEELEIIGNIYEKTPNNQTT